MAQTTIRGEQLKDIWEMVEEITIGSAVTTQDFTATLDGDVDGAYMIEGRIVNDQVSNASINIRINSANWATNRQYNSASGTSVTASRDTATNMALAIANGGYTQFRTFFPCVITGDGRTCYTIETRGNTTSLANITFTHDITTPANSVNITSLGVASSIASGIGVGSVLRLWKRRK